MPDGSVSIAPSLNKALDLRQLALGQKMTLKFACVVLNGNLSNSGGHVSIIMCPVNVGQTVKFQRMACVFLGDDRPVLRTNLVHEVATAPAKRALTTIRIHVPGKIVDQKAGMLQPHSQDYSRRQHAMQRRFCWEHPLTRPCYSTPCHSRHLFLPKRHRQGHFH